MTFNSHATAADSAARAERADLAEAGGPADRSDPSDGLLKVVVAISPLLLCGVAANYARATVSPLQEAIRIGLDLTDNQIALVQGLAIALPISLAAFPLGLLVDRYKRVRILLVLAVMNLVGTLLTALSDDFTLLFIARGLVGLGSYGTVMTVPSLISDLCGPEMRGRAVSLSGVGYVVGRSVAFVAGGALLGMNAGVEDGWQTAIYWLAVPLVLVLVMILLLREPARGEVGRASEGAVRDRLAEFWRYRGIVLPILVGFVVAEMADGAALIWAAPIFMREYGLSPAQVGSLLGMVLLVSGGAGMFAGGVMADICQRRGGTQRSILLMSILALIGIPAGLFALAPSPVLASLLLGLLMLVGSMISMMSSAILMVALPNELRGFSMGAAMFGNTVFCIGLAPLMVSSLSGLLGGSSSLAIALSIVCVATSLIGAAAFFVGTRSIRMAPVVKATE